jgi:hypothetical protein
MRLSSSTTPALASRINMAFVYAWANLPDLSWEQSHVGENAGIDKLPAKLAPAHVLGLVRSLSALDTEL